jgi:hypothetical protein
MRPQVKVDHNIIRELVEERMGKQRRQHSEQFKFKLALEAAKGLRTGQRCPAAIENVGRR